jgi:hypothetical protein
VGTAWSLAVDAPGDVGRPLDRRLLASAPCAKVASPPQEPACSLSSSSAPPSAIGRLPGLRLDRAGAALVGASLMVASGSLSLEEAYRAIDLDTIALLLGMMIVAANLRFAGFFQLANHWIARVSCLPKSRSSQAR